MQINISGHHVEVTEAMRDHLHEKLDRLIRHYEKITNIDVILSVDKLVQKAEATLHVSGKDFFAEDHDDDMYHAIDRLVDKLDRQLLKHKGKIASRRR